MLTPDTGTSFLRDVSTHLPDYTASLYRRPQYSQVLLTLLGILYFRSQWKEPEDPSWTKLAQDRDQWRALLLVVLKMLILMDSWIR